MEDRENLIQHRTAIDTQVTQGDQVQEAPQSNQSTTKSSKKKYIWWGVGLDVLAAAITVILIFALKKGGGDDPDTDDHYNPYKVIAYDASSNTYTLSRI